MMIAPLVNIQKAIGGKSPLRGHKSIDFIAISTDFITPGNHKSTIGPFSIAMLNYRRVCETL